ARAFQAAVVVYDFAGAAVITAQRGGYPLSVHGFTNGAQAVAVRTNVAAALLVRAARRRTAVIPIMVPVAVSVVITVAVAVSIPLPAMVSAAELAVFIADLVIAAGKLLQRRIHPLAIARLAAGPK